MALTTAELRDRLDRFPRVRVAHVPTPIEPMANLGRELGIDLAIKRDDCTGIGFGGNKVRQLEFYFGAAEAEDADTVLITGAVQSNFTRATGAIARRLGLDCHLQLEERVAGQSDLYHDNGSVLLDRLMGVHIHHFPEGENEAGADAAMQAIADRLRGEGRKPYVIPLRPGAPPLGDLGYVAAAIELAAQIKAGAQVDEIFVGSGSGATHSGLLFGLRALGLDIPVTGVCVRRAASLQAPRIARRVKAAAELMDFEPTIGADDIRVDDGSLGDGYGTLPETTRGAIRRTAELEGTFLDPIYTGTVMAGLIRAADSGRLAGRQVLFWHTGGQPALYAYGGRLLSDD